MKYIRTSSGIYKFDDTNDYDYLNYCSSAVADNIEDLLYDDEFVVVDGNLPYKVYKLSIN